MSSVQATGDFAADAETGRRYAELAVGLIFLKITCSCLATAVSVRFIRIPIALELRPVGANFRSLSSSACVHGRESKWAGSVIGPCELSKTAPIEIPSARTNAVGTTNFKVIVSGSSRTFALTYPRTEDHLPLSRGIENWTHESAPKRGSLLILPARKTLQRPARTSRFSWRPPTPIAPAMRC